MSKLAWETVDAEVVYSCAGFDVVNQRVRLPDGTEAPFDYISESESVVILPFRPDGDVVVIEEWRQAVGRVNHGLPAGTLESDEQPVDAVDRELQEETGYEAGTVSHLTTVEPSNGFADSVFHYFLAEDCTQTSKQSLDTDETIRVSTTEFESLLSAVEDGSLRDGRSAYGITYYELFGE